MWRDGFQPVSVSQRPTSQRQGFPSGLFLSRVLFYHRRFTQAHPSLEGGGGGDGQRPPSPHPLWVTHTMCDLRDGSARHGLAPCQAAGRAAVSRAVAHGAWHAMLWAVLSPRCTATMC